jgi:hypothetical protein
VLLRSWRLQKQLSSTLSQKKNSSQHRSEIRQ